MMKANALERRSVMDEKLRNRIVVFHQWMMINEEGYYHSPTVREMEAEAIIEELEKLVNDLESFLSAPPRCL